MKRAAFAAVSADPVATWLAVRAGAAEAHPLWSWAIGGVGLTGAMIVRLLAGLMLVAAVAVAVEHDGVPITRQVLTVLTAVFAAVTVWNVAVWVTA